MTFVIGLSARKFFFGEPAEEGTKGWEFGGHGDGAVFAGEPPKEGLQVVGWASIRGRARKLVFVGKRKATQAF
ncbi:MAG: hypothetical protein REDVDVYQ_000157 [Candidatus Fervidibacter sp.]